MIPRTVAHSYLEGKKSLDAVGSIQTVQAVGPNGSTLSAKKKTLHNVKALRKLSKWLYLSMYWLQTLWFPSLQCSRRTHTPLWTCWGKVWGHCGVCPPCLPSRFDGSQSSPSSLLMHAPMPSGDSASDTKRKRKFCARHFATETPTTQARFKADLTAYTTCKVKILLIKT